MKHPTNFRTLVAAHSCVSKNLLRRMMSLTSSRLYNYKSIYESNEECLRPRIVYGQPYPEWRQQWIKRKGEWSSKLALFNEKNPSTEIMNALQKLPNSDFQQVKDWWKSMKLLQEIENQKFLPERVAKLGSNLAAVHFFTYRQAAVRLKDSNDWISGNLTTLADELPHTYVEGYQVEAVDCSNFYYGGIRFEGLQNLAGLNFLKWLSLKNQKHLDAFCLDRIAGQNGKSLEYLDISSCDLDLGCVFALARMPELQTLIVKDPGDSVQVQAALSFLENDRPNLMIKAVQNDSLVCSDTPPGKTKYLSPWNDASRQ